MNSTKELKHPAENKYSSTKVLERIQQSDPQTPRMGSQNGDMTFEKFFAEKGFTQEQIADLLKNYKAQDLRDMAWLLSQKTANGYEDLINQFKVAQDPQIKVLIINVAAILFREIEKNKTNEQPSNPLFCSDGTFEVFFPYLIRLFTHAFPQDGKKDLSFAEKEQLIIVALINLNRYLKHSREILKTENLLHLFACSFIETCRTNLEQYFKDSFTAQVFGIVNLQEVERGFLKGLNNKLFMLKVENGDLEYELMGQGVRTGLNNGFSLSMLRAPELEEYKEPEPVFRFKPDASKLNKKAMQFRPGAIASNKRKFESSEDGKSEVTEKPDFKEITQPAIKKARNR